MTENLSSLDLRAFLRSCHSFLQEDMTLDSWSAYQKYLLIAGHANFGLYIRQLKKISRADQIAIQDGFSNGQVESKLWLVEILSHVLPDVEMDVHILGSWFGLLPRMMMWMDYPCFKKMRCYDKDPRCASWARFLNEPESYGDQHQYLTQDMYDLDYISLLQKNSLVINTSCEHLEDFHKWYQQIPTGTLLALQGNDFIEPEEHHNPWKDLPSFAQDTPMETLLFEGSLSLAKYSRFMRIGVKA